MGESPRERYARWGLEEVLLRHPGLRLTPSGDDSVTLAGELQFRVLGPGGVEIEDAYEVELRVPGTFPMAPPTARETGGRIPGDFHKLKGGYLCLGAPTEVRLKLVRSPTLAAFVEQLVIPYLYGHSHFVEHGSMPYGELEHGTNGLLGHFVDLFRTRSPDAARQFVRLASLRRRDANKRPCPCGSGRRLGRCHNRRVNRLRTLLGRRWFRSELDAIDDDG